ncbi:MAG: type II toxin-antitoxin system HicA family toxin [Pyrinomonadaceae bacterium]
MKLPRDVSGRQLVRSLQTLGYEVTRQTGSHIRITTESRGIHHITIPDHQPLRVGTLSAVLREVAEHFDMTREELIGILCLP